MTSERASHANRRNSAKSTGPRTPSGKAQSKQNARKHGLSIVDSNHRMEAEIERLAGLIAGGHGGNVAIFEAARTAAEAQVYLHRVQAFKTALFQSGAKNEQLGAEAGQCSSANFMTEIFAQLEQLDRYETRALSRRKFAFRRFLVLANR